MSKKLYVGNLSFNMDEQTLNGLFSQFGSVESTKIIIDRETGRSKGFAFVEMSSATDGSTAIQQLNGSEQLQRAMTVSEAKPMVPREQGRSSGGGGFSRGSRY